MPSHSPSQLDTVVKEIADEMAQRPDRGEVATYIPELAHVDPSAFGLAVIYLIDIVATLTLIPERKGAALE